MKIIFFILLFLSVALFISCKEEENGKELKPLACFSYSMANGDEENEMIVTFNNCSENANSYYWNFGDGVSSILPRPEHEYYQDGYYPVSLTAKNEFGSNTLVDTIYIEWAHVDKPNIYLYPEEQIDICVRLNFPQGGEVVKSIPEYKKEWCVTIEPYGLIDSTYEFLFYESVQPDVWQYEKGWCVKRENLQAFFESNMQAYNFNEKEISDFIEYWIPRLNEYDNYKIYPQCNNLIDRVIQINFTVEPDNVFRLFYGVVGTSEYQEIPEPQIEPINRTGFEVVEWGVFRK